MRFGLVIGLLAVGVSSASAFADSTGTGTFTGDGGTFMGKGILMTTGSVVTGLTSDTFAVSLIAPAGDSSPGFHGNDNILQPDTFPVFTEKGLAFFATADDGTYEVDFFADAKSATNYSAYVVDEDNVAFTVPVNFSLDPTTGGSSTSALPPGRTREFTYSFASATQVTPEPASVALLGTGLVGLAGVLRRRWA